MIGSGSGSGSGSDSMLWALSGHGQPRGTWPWRASPRVSDGIGPWLGGGLTGDRRALQCPVHEQKDERVRQTVGGGPQADRARRAHLIADDTGPATHMLRVVNGCYVQGASFESPRPILGRRLLAPEGRRDCCPPRNRLMNDAMPSRESSCHANFIPPRSLRHRSIILFLSEPVVEGTDGEGRAGAIPPRGMKIRP